MEFGKVLAERRSVRGFLEKPVPRETLESVFAAAQRAPSWCNIQPWRVYVSSGEVTRQLATRMVEAARGGTMTPDHVWPFDYPEPYNTHRRECGKALYGAMGIERSDAAGRAAAWLANYEAFGAPHMAIVAMDRRFDFWGAIDVGCWLQSFLLACVDAGLATCPQATLGAHPAIVRELLAIPAEESVLFGVAIGYEDASVKANNTRTSRGAVADNVKFVGF